VGVNPTMRILNAPIDFPSPVERPDVSEMAARFQRL